MKRKLTFILYALIIACNIPVISIGQAGDLKTKQDPSQYGKPFNNVPDRRDVTLTR